MIGLSLGGAEFMLLLREFMLLHNLYLWETAPALHAAFIASITL